MTDISKELVKCIKCGKESSQMVIWSINYSLGDKESNDNLLRHKQKCPYCGYEAIRIDSLEDNIKNKLNREILIKTTDDFFKKIKEFEIFKIPNSLYLNYFKQLTDLFNQYNFESDKRFVTYGRLDFLKEELTERLHDDKLKYPNPNWKEKWDNRLGAFWDLYDYIRGDRYIAPHHIPQELTFSEILLNNDNYYKDEIICKEERDVLLDMINEMKNFIQSKKLVYEISNNDWGEKTIYSINTRNWYIYDDLSVKYEIINGENKKKEYFHNINEEQLKKIDKNIELAKLDDRKVDACDGEAWEFIQYKDNNISWKRDLGYIYGIESLEEICDMLYKMVKDDLEVFDVEEKKGDIMGLFNKKKDYDANPEDNVPQIVYGIPDFLKEKWDKEEGTKEVKCPYCGSTDLREYLYGKQNADYDRDKYILGGCEVSLDNPQYKCKNCNKDINLNKKYDVNVEDNIPREVYGIPDALRNKYDTKPEDNIPQKVYGVPNNFVLNKPKSENVRISVSNDKDNYVLSTVHYIEDDTTDLTFGNLNELAGKTIDDITTRIPNKFYYSFITKLENIINMWDSNYNGNKSIKWNIKIETLNSKKIISGNGEFPKNWNQLIDLLEEYESLFYEKKDLDKEKIADMEYNKLSFDEIVRNRVKDSFWEDLILKYFRDELKVTDQVAKVLLKDVMKYDDIFNEFTKYLTQRTYEIKDAIEVNGYTAKKISKLNPSFKASGVYSFLQLLRDDPEEAERIIKAGFPNKDALPPIFEKTEESDQNDIVKKYLEEIKDEVDEEMIKLGLMTVKDNQKIPVFGSIHTRWNIEKRILKERYNIDWKSPEEMNPYINYD